jgi:serine/threonine protein kinase
MASDLRALPLGMRLSDYQIERVLGHGGFGITYLALDLSLDQRVAIKEYYPREFALRDSSRTIHPTGNAEDRDNFAWGLERFQEEAKTLARFIRVTF